MPAHIAISQVCHVGWVEEKYHVRLNTYTLEEGRQKAAMLEAEGFLPLSP
ncbi:MAG: hypothetical protein F6K54_21675 [Okeania sp. SIO3B5]|nr:hypothetical protein [Okeania sp. SIO3B5]NEO55447.1 hypothetical protein [Okeania sp. SIO3B5]